MTKMPSTVRKLPSASSQHKKAFTFPRPFCLFQDVLTASPSPFLVIGAACRYRFPPKKPSFPHIYCRIPSPPHTLLTIERGRERETERQRDEGHVQGDNGGNTSNGGEPCHGIRPNLGAASWALLFSLTPPPSAQNQHHQRRHRLRRCWQHRGGRNRGLILITPPRPVTRTNSVSSK